MKSWGNPERDWNFWLIISVILFALGGVCTGAGKFVGLIWGTN